MKKRRSIALVLALAMVLSVLLAGCGGGGGGNSASDENTYTWWIYSGADSMYYYDYQENPAIQYTLQNGWGPENKNIALQFLVPAPGSEADNYSTMIASGDLPDIIDAVICEPAPVMVEKGYALDITEYVERNMPNYVALVHSTDAYCRNAVYVVDGVEHYYNLSNLFDKPESIFQGYQYRRDWIVKYGTNPTTGAPFTGGYTDPGDVDSWEDDVVFPSGGSDPVYISDWEWMFEIFTRAQEDLGITDSYCVSLYYPGFTWSGGLLSCFGGGTCLFYQDADGNAQFGGDKKQFRAYLECMNAWYEKGWLDSDFYQRTSDAFYSIDDTAVRQGKVPVFNGQQSQLGGRMDMHDGGYTEGIYIAGAAYPINDIYGDDDCKYIEPDCMMGGERTSGGILITPSAAGKDLDTLCAYLDQFYAEDGALLRTLGLSAGQASEFSSNSFYSDYGLTNGAYYIGDDGRYVKDPTIVNDAGGLAIAAAFTKAPGLTLVENVDLGLAPSYQASIDRWTQYPNTAFFQGSITTNMMSTEDANACDQIRNRLLEYETNNAADFITGKKDIHNDADWDNWCTSLQKYNYQKALELYQPYIDAYPFA